MSHLFMSFVFVALFIFLPDSAGDARISAFIVGMIAFLVYLTAKDSERRISYARLAAEAEEKNPDSLPFFVGTFIASLDGYHPHLPGYHLLMFDSDEGFKRGYSKNAALIAEIADFKGDMKVHFDGIFIVKIEKLKSEAL